MRLALPWAAVSKSEHWLNGEKVAAKTIGSEDWKNVTSTSKFKKRPDFGTKKGRIMLRDCESKVWYRNLVSNEL